MNNLINYTAFEGELLLDLQQGEAKEFLNNLIAQKQKELLIQLLGMPLYLEFENGLAQPVIEQRWLDLRDGASFTAEYRGKEYTLQFGGVTQMLKYFIFYYFQREVSQPQTFAGRVQTHFENSTPVSNVPNMVRIYNKAIDLYGKPYSTDSDILVIIPQNNIITLNVESRLMPSCYNFIYQTEKEATGTYPNWIFTQKKYII
jgi:hypothetical protein